MKLRNYIFDDTEGKYSELDSKITKIVLEEIEKNNNKKFIFDSSDDELLVLLLNGYEEEVKNVLIKYKYNINEMLFTLITRICVNKPESANDYIEILNLLNPNYNIFQEDGLYVLEDGIKLEFQRFTDIIDDEVVIDLINKGECLRRCHLIADILYRRMENFLIVTSQMPRRFGGYFYHTYFMEDNYGVVDIANNGVFSKEGFYHYFRPKEIISYPSEELYERFNKIKEPSKDAKTLQLALEKMKERYN